MPADREALADTARPVRWGLSLRLFAILTLLGAIAVLVTGILGYVRARDALLELRADGEEAGHRGHDDARPREEPLRNWQQATHHPSRP